MSNEETELLCPLCRKSLDVMPNGLAICRSVLLNASSYEEFLKGSCPMAAYGVQMPVEIWQKLLTSTSADIRTQAANSYPLKQIKATFWATFDGAGELWFPSKERGEEGLQTEVQWQRFLGLLMHQRRIKETLNNP